MKIAVSRALLPVIEARALVEKRAVSHVRHIGTVSFFWLPQIARLANAKQIARGQRGPLHGLRML